MAVSRFRFTCIAFLVLLSMTPLWAMGQQGDVTEVGNRVSIIDSRGIEVALPAFPERIVSLSPNITETIYALGLGDKLVGRTDYCDYPAEASSVPSMGDLFTPSIEKIVSTGADIVIISNLGQMQTVDAIEKMGIPVAFLDEPGTMEGTFNIIRKVGIITGAEEAADLLVSDMQRTLQAVKDSIGPGPRPSAYYVAGFGEWGDYTATGDTYLHDLITMAGARNIAADAVNWSYQLELLLAQDPDIIILPPMWGSTFDQTKKEFANHPGYADLGAVVHDRIITIESNLMERQGPRSALAVEQLARAIRALSR